MCLQKKRCWLQKKYITAPELRIHCLSVRPYSCADVPFLPRGQQCTEVVDLRRAPLSPENATLQGSQRRIQHQDYETGCQYTLHVSKPTADSRKKAQGRLVCRFLRTRKPLPNSAAAQGLQVCEDDMYSKPASDLPKLLSLAGYPDRYVNLDNGFS